MASTKITRTSSASSEKKLTISYWLKRSTTGEESVIGNTNDGSNWAMFYFNGANKLQFASYVGGSYVMRYTTNRTFSDVGAWYHLVATVDVSLASPEVKVYVNGEEQTSLQYNVTPSQNADIGWFNAWNFEIGVQFGSSYYLNGSLAHLYYIQGYIHPASTFGETDSTSGIWKPKTNPTINYGGNGGNSCFLKFENSGNMDLDSGSNNISFTTSGTLTQNVDTPNNNFATLNPLHKGNTLTGFTFANGNNTITFGSTSYPYTFSTQALSSGKWYAEFKVTANPNDVTIGISNGEKSTYLSHSQYDYAYVGSNGNIQSNQSASPAGYGSALSNNDILGVAMDLDNNKLYFSINGTFQNSGVPTSGSTGTGAKSITAPSSTTNGVYHFAVGDFNSAASSVQCNFGNGYFGTTAISSEGSNASGIGKFEYDVPTGYTALSTKGLNE